MSKTKRISVDASFSQDRYREQEDEEESQKGIETRYALSICQLSDVKM
jgi:hypothetical protein